MKIIFKRFNSLSVKVVILYTALAVLNIAFFTTIVFENQVDSITDSTKLKAEKIVSASLTALKKFYTENKNRDIFKLQDEKKIIKQIESIIKPLVTNYIIYKESGDIVYKSDENLKLHRSFVKDGMRAVADLDFTGKEYFVKIDINSFTMFFYVPLKKYTLENMLMYIPYDLHHLDENINNLYSQVKIIFVITSIFHIIFAILLFRIIIKPIQSLRTGSKKIADGDLESRVKLERDDEIGDLAVSFNEMADSIQDKVTTLDNTNKDLISAKRIADKDMDMAVHVQEGFLMENPPQTELWDTAFLFKPVSGVSGDFYDFYLSDNELRGAALFDVSGHGVASGLVTMIAKQIIFRNFNVLKDKHLPEILGTANDEIIEQIDNVDNYLTGIILRFDEDTVDYVNASHTDLMLKRENNVQVIDSGTEFRGMFLGMSMLRQEYKGIRFSMKEGDSLLLFSDCLNETRNMEDKMFDNEGVFDSFKNCPGDASAQEIIDYITRDFYNFIENRELEDDLTLVVIKKKTRSDSMK